MLIGNSYSPTDFDKQPLHRSLAPLPPEAPAQLGGRGLVDFAAVLVQDDPVALPRGVGGNVAAAHILRDGGGHTVEGIAIASAAGREMRTALNRR